MLDEAISDADVIHLPDATASKKRVEPAGPIFGPVFSKDGEKPISGADFLCPGAKRNASGNQGAAS